MSGWYRWQDDVLLLDCYLKPRARREGVLGLHDGRLHVQVKAAPVEGKANTALCHMMAAAFGTPKSRVTLRSGAGHRFKTVAIEQPGREPDWFGELDHDVKLKHVATRSFASGLVQSEYEIAG